MSRYATITVIGRDKTGVVARVTNLLFDTSANIEALEEQVTRGQFSMTIQASWKAASFNEKALGQGLRALGRELGMEIKWWFTDPKRPQRRRKQNKSDTFTICACHPCAGAMLIFSVSFQFLRMTSFEVPPAL